MILYNYWRSSCSYRVRIGLELKKMIYEYRPVHLVRDGGEQHKDDYLSLSPSGYVPCLVDGERTISESLAILAYLDAKKAEPPLFPKDPYAHAQVLAMCETINAGIQPLQNLSLLKELSVRFNATEEAKAQWIAHWISKGFLALESRVAQFGGRFCFGDQATAADAFLIPQVYNAIRWQVDMTQFPHLQRIDDHCRQLPAFQAAEPANQPDAIA